MRISDWSSDVCSSDLPRLLAAIDQVAEEDAGGMGDARHPGIVGEGGEQRVQQVGATVDIADRADQMVGVERPGSVHPVASLDRHHAVTKPQKPTTRKRSEEHTSELQSLMRIS